MYKIKMKIKTIVERISKMGAPYFLFIFVVLVFLAIFMCVKGAVPEAEETYGTFDDQRSTLWPMLISLVATLLGSLITTYVFLKESLDRTVDLKPYYGEVIQAYRERTMRFLWRYSVVTVGLITIVVILYIFFYFFDWFASNWLKAVISLSYLSCMFVSMRFMYRCININKGLERETECLMKEKIQTIKTYAEEFQGIIGHIRREISPSENMEQIETRNALIEWLQIEWLQIEGLQIEGLQIEDSDTGSGRKSSTKSDVKKKQISKKQFINRFSEWEKLLLLLIENSTYFLNEQSQSDRIRTAVLDGEKVKAALLVEQKDAKENGWNCVAIDEINHFRNEWREERRGGVPGKKKYSGEDFANTYLVLDEYRNLLQVQEENSKGSTLYIEEGEEDLLKLFALFRTYLSIEVSCMLPKIMTFFPAGAFLHMNLYNTRFEDSSFRMSSFKKSVFARSKMKNCNLGMSLFQQCEFFNADSRDCSLSNTLFQECGFKDAFFDNVDFTGAHFDACDMKGTEFTNSFLVNMEIRNTTFEINNFSDSKLWNIKLENIANNDFQQCNFTNASLSNVHLIGQLEKLDEQTIMDILLPDRKLFWNKVKSEGKNRTTLKTVWTEIQSRTEVRMRESIFENAELRDFRLCQMDVKESVFAGARMKGIKLVCVNMAGGIMSRANMRESHLTAVNMKSVVLNEAIFYKAVCELVNLEDASLHHLHASQTRWKYCSFERSDCSSIDLTRARIKESSFRDAMLGEAELTNSVCKKVVFTNCIAANMLSSYTNFQNCIFKNAYLSQSNFNYTFFQNCILELADFSETTVTNVTFEHCDFKNINFRNTCFINAVFKDNENMVLETFEGCTFIHSQFKGTNQSFEEELKKAAAQDTIKIHLVGGEN